MTRASIQLANLATARARHRVRRWRWRPWGLRVTSVFWYGAVDLDSAHLVVWVIVRGGRERNLPAWLFLERDEAEARAARASIPETLLTELEGLCAEVRGAFADVGWPDADSISVGVESNARVGNEGGFSYFR